jgi:tetratricopeptide (TPR) repeat protein
MKRYAVLALVLLLGASAGALTWKRWPRTPPPQPPALDPAGVDPVVWRAVEAARRQVERTPESARAWGRLGMVLLAHQFRDESVVCLARAEQLDPRNPRWPYYQALAVRRSAPESAIAHLRRAVAADSEYETPSLLLAELLLQRGETEEAETQFEAVLHRNPANSRARLGLAQIAFERDDWTVCLEQLHQALDDPHTRKAAHTFLAEVQQRRGQRTAAQEALRQAHELPDDLPWPDPLAETVQALVVGHLEVVTHAAALLQQRQAPQAIPLLQRAVEDYPESSWARVLLGRAYISVGALDDAEKVLRAALKREPDSVEGQFYLGVVLSERKNFAAAIPYFRAATRLKADYALAWYNLGVCLKQQGDRAAAVSAYRTAIACKPRFAEARINLGELLAEQGDTAAAVEQLRQGVRLKPQDDHARRLLETLSP